MTALSLLSPQPTLTAAAVTGTTPAEATVATPAATPLPATEGPASATPPADPTDAPAPTASPSTEPTATLAAGATQVAAADGMVQVYVPAGEFSMGSAAGPPDQQPVHTLFLDSFWLDRIEVTNTMYALCVEAGGCSPPLETRSITRASYYDEPAFAEYPVLFVNWPQARAYCEWAGRRLPTEAEWEKAARGTDQRPYPWGSEPPSAGRLNWAGAGLGDTVAVGQYPSGASPYGALEMAGNASEWVFDYYDPAYYAASPAENPTGPAQTGCPGGECRVLRGGNWNSRDDEAAATFRLFYGPNDSRDAFGIRCAQAP
jgi:serine/threonine-protein kinase